MNKNLEKKQSEKQRAYVSPQVTVIEMETENSLLSASGNAGGIGQGDPYGE
ncbi:MAG: hypothetical protein ACTTJK_00405 [Phocaeicola sp.]|uniref:hypothetical protein n=1 Tax=Phocaeicola TaxID=909656 RepID=UPI00234EF323|nr:hypothetical protein [Phocaeicola oris]MCE2617421.1 hypothetical protein [Phocaeicola oris]